MTDPKVPQRSTHACVYLVQVYVIITMDSVAMEVLSSLCSLRSRNPSGNALRIMPLSL